MTMTFQYILCFLNISTGILSKIYTNFKVCKIYNDPKKEDVFA